MADSFAVFVPRWTQKQIASFYDDERIMRARRRSTAACAFALVIATVIQPLWYWGWLVAAVAMALLCEYSAKSPLRMRVRFEALRDEWLQLLKKSAPDAAMRCPAKLENNERLVYASFSERYAQRSVNASVIDTLLDSGELVVTDQRVLFLGKTQTLSIDNRQILRFASSHNGHRITFEYAGRPPGETFTVEAALFRLCMRRRGNFSEFNCDPPAPLPLDETVLRSSFCFPLEPE